jgi:YVTN family beta-propeller protein
VRQDSSTAAPSTDVYAGALPPALDSLTRAAKPLVYVANSGSGTISEIDPANFAVVGTLQLGGVPRQIVPSFDRTKLWVANDAANTLTAVDPNIGKPAAQLRADDPFDLYFSPNGSVALAIAERHNRIDFREPATMKLVSAEPVHCAGLSHLDFTADDKYAIATCTGSGQLVKIDLANRKPLAYLTLRGAAHPVDIRSSPNGTVFLVTDMSEDGVHVIDPDGFVETGFIKTGKAPYGIVVGAAGTPFYIANRGATSIYGGRHGHGTVTVLDPETQRVIATWRIPNGGSPTMGGVTADGKQLWLSAEFDDEAYVLDPSNGKFVARISVGREPGGLRVWPQPGLRPH